jgi:hypothetical protein
MNKLSKTYRLIPFLLFFILMLTSCTRVIYSHNDVMDAYRTKSDIITRFGLPTEKRQEGDIEEWYYSYGSRTSSVYNNIAYGNNRPVIIGRSNTTDKYIKFTLKNDKVTNWTTQGVNLQETEVDKKKRIWAILGSIAFISFFVWLGSLG